MSIIGRPLIAGSSGGGSATLITKNITANGTYNASSDNADGYSSVTVNVGGDTPATKKAVNFYDYDGTLLHSYTAQEAQALTALPANPSHTGLTAQGWNYTLAQMKTQVTSMGTCDIGQMYVTDDGKTRLYCHFEEGRLSPYLGICPNGTVTVDWGDGSATNTLTGTSLTTVKNVQHVYASAGDYMITLTASSGTTFTFYGTSSYYSYILRKATDSTSSKNPSNIYRNAIQKIELGSGITSIGQYAFYYCYSLSSITIPSTVTSIQSYAFQNCYSLSSITIPSTVASIGTSAFYNCYSLSSIAIPSTVTSINGYAFYDCYSLSSIAIPSTVTSIGSDAFQNCYSLSSITIPSTVTSISGNIVYGCYSLSSITIPSTVTSIGTSAFYGCYSLYSIAIPSTVTSIGTYAFYNCYSLSSITIPSKVTSIQSYAFQNCYSLSSITIPSTVASIGSYAFQSCYGLAEMTFKPTTAPTVSNSNAWTNIQTDCRFYIPFSALAAYLSETNYPSSATYTYIGFATYNSGTTLPTQDSTQAYNVVWYASKADAIAETNAITQGNGNEIYCRYTAV